MDVYCETSAVNYFCDKLTIPDAVATKALQWERGRRWVISPVVIWEILLASNDDRKEKLIRFAQHLFDSELLPSPEELLVKYIEQGCPSVETTRPLISASPMAAVWRDLCAIPEKTFVYDKGELKRRTQLIARIIRDLHKLTRNRDIVLLPYTDDVDFDLTLSQLVNQLSFVKSGAYVSQEKRRIYRISLFYVLLVMCAHAGVDPQPFAKFWARLRIHKTIDRLMYVLHHLEVLVHRGPFVQMAYMTLVQSSQAYSRGLFWDTFHCSYLTYVSWMFAEDPHFQSLRTAMKDHPLAERIHRPSELEWTFEDRSVHFPETFITT